ncbi:MAG: prevent-host-death protein [Alphaproteobacteria bacterium]|nr:MAG: prevent-host-death protein [Alphaproteobacteria bacterium]
MTTVTASEFQKNFGAFKETAQREPVKITSNGRESVVLISAASFAEYEQFKKQKYAYGGETTDEFKTLLTERMDKHKHVLEGLAKGEMSREELTELYRRSASRREKPRRP